LKGEQGRIEITKPEITKTEEEQKNTESLT
jgi:hypothetical protein